jgi:predicted nucleotidyltransferase
MPAGAAIDLSPGHLATVKGILAAHVPGHAVWAFGSRVSGSAWRFSDLDLAIDGQEPLACEQKANLRLAFSESNLPFTVDLVDLRRCSADFARAIAIADTRTPLQ